MKGIIAVLVIIGGPFLIAIIVCVIAYMAYSCGVITSP